MHNEPIKIKEISTNGTDIIQLIFQLEHPIDFFAGQYVIISFPEQPENSHSFSVVEYDNQANTIRIDIKELGIFTHKLANLQTNDIMLISGPYGKFRIRDTEKNIVMIAGGIGITPLYCMLNDWMKKNYDHELYLFYSVKTIDSMPFLDKLNSYRQPKLHLRYYLTLEQRAGFMNKRVDIQEIIATVSDYQKCDYYLCGPPPMIESLRKDLLNSGIAPDSIISESFS